MDYKSTSKEIIQAIRKSLTPELLSKEWKPFADEHCTGHCYIGAEAAYHLLGGKKAKLKVFVASYEEGTHWWLVDIEGKIIDPTECQYTAYGDKPPYHLGRCCGFLTTQPSKRAQVVINRVKEFVRRR